MVEKQTADNQIWLKKQSLKKNLKENFKSLQKRQFFPRVLWRFFKKVQVFKTPKSSLSTSNLQQIF